VPDDDLRRRTEAALDQILPRRDPHARVGVLGAGSDDLDSGRKYLGILAPGGYMVPSWPVEFGGMGLASEDAGAVKAVLREFEAPDLYPYMVGVDLVGPTILAHGSEEQKARWLAKIRSGEEIWCQMFSEPDAGSDLAGLKARAVRDGDGWRVTGSKVWTSRGHYARWGLLLARHDPSLPKHAGITAFGLDMGSAGVTVRPLVQSNGDSHFNEVFMDDVFIPDTDRIGAPGEGWRVAITCLSFERGALGGGLGVTPDQLDRLGRLAGPDPVALDQWARRMADYKIIQWTALRARAAREAGKAPGPEDSGTKLRANGLIKPLAALGLDLAGPAATVYAGEPDEWQSMFLMSPSLSIRGGTDEIQHNILGERVLGLPPEPRVDKDKPFADTV
jgi:alkylation response protein AidB-like acyl-CoA dehydrogenase